MIESQNINNDPKWGNQNRELKAKQIYYTINLYLGTNSLNSMWLDVGCGSGKIAAEIASHVKEIHGVDPQPWEQWNTLRSEKKNLHFHHGTLSDLSSTLSKMDVIICNQVYEHTQNPKVLIEQIEKLLKPEGIVYFAGPNLLFPIEPHIYWPFVHWLPRRMAIRIMSALGSRNTHNLDAYSTHYWKLHAWLKPHFQVSNALPILITQVIPILYADRWQAKLLKFLPNIFVSAFTPFSPGFVFILEKNK